MNRTEAWVLHNRVRDPGKPAGLQREEIELGAIENDEVLVEPIYGCWEGNMGHAVARQPIDVAEYRQEERIVIGNAGVVRVLQPGPYAGMVKEGDLCMVCPAVWDEHGFMHRAFAYDAAGTCEVLAKRSKMRQQQLVPVPVDSKYSVRQWAPFSTRYITAWANWNIASRTYCALQGDANFTWGWGGGTAFAELTLARLKGWKAFLISSEPSRLGLIAAAGVTAVDRSSFAGLRYDEKKIAADAEYAAQYRAAEAAFLERVGELTQGGGVSIFVDHLGTAVTHATVKALGRPGVIATSGWKTGMKMTAEPGEEAMHWHSFVHTHYARREDCAPAVEFAEEYGWIPDDTKEVYGWDEIPRLAEEYEGGRIATYFPLFQINAE